MPRYIVAQHDYKGEKFYCVIDDLRRQEGLPMESIHEGGCLRMMCMNTISSAATACDSLNHRFDSGENTDPPSLAECKFHKDYVEPEDANKPARKKPAGSPASPKSKETKGAKAQNSNSQIREAFAKLQAKASAQPAPAPVAFKMEYQDE